MIKKYFINATDIVPQVTWGTSPEDVLPITGVVPNAENMPVILKKKHPWNVPLDYMGLKPGRNLPI